MTFLEAFYDEMRKLALNKDEEFHGLNPAPSIFPDFKREAENAKRGRMPDAVACLPTVTPIFDAPRDPDIDPPKKKAQITKTSESIVMDLLDRIIRPTATKKAPLPAPTEKTAEGAVMVLFKDEARQAKERNDAAKMPKIPRESVPNSIFVGDQAVAKNPWAPAPARHAKPVPLSERTVKTGVDKELLDRLHQHISDRLGRDPRARARLRKRITETASYLESQPALAVAAAEGGKCACPVALEVAEKLGAFKSQAQRRKFYAMAASGEISQKVLTEWEESTPKNKKLPERVPKPKESKTAGIFDRLFRRQPTTMPAAEAKPIISQLEHPQKVETANASEGKKGLFRKIMVFSDDIILGGMKLLKKDAPLPG